MNKAFRPGQAWLDTSGNRIQAHAGKVHYENGTFYWYGENKERTTHGSGIWHWGVRCYSSTDLYNWHDLGLIIPPDVDDPSSPLHPAQSLDRPRIIYNAATGQYVCWLKIMGSGNTQTSTVLTADSFLGPYTIVKSWLRPLGMNAGDPDLVVDPTDGKGYYYFERVHSELICADLTDDYTDVTAYYSTHFPRPQPPFVRESPSYFRRQRRHYLITSGTTHYFPNPSEVAVASSYHGPWTVLGDPHPDDPYHTSFRSQISCVFRHPHKHDLYIAMGDRWLPGMPPEQSNLTELFTDLYADDHGLDNDIDEDAAKDWNTSIADYVWLPLRFDGEMAVIDWHDEWRVEDYE